MKELLEYIARHLVEDPDAVEVTDIEDDRGVVLQLKVAPDDMGKVIGRSGRMARAIRALVRAAGSRQDMATKVEIVE
ncbi:MAG TPA: KH domain-containing protein [Actinomycetota bacterium]|nr:KH domain-containing protein [Actinomycetota bacterium]